MHGIIKAKVPITVFCSEISVENAKVSSIVNFPMHLCGPSLTSRASRYSIFMKSLVSPVCGYFYQAHHTDNKYGKTHFSGFLHELGIVFLDVVPGSNRRFQFISYHHTRTLSGGPTDESHDASASVRESALQEGGKWRETINKHKALDTL